MLQFIFLCLILVSCHVYGEDLTVLPLDVSKDLQVICNAHKQKDADLKVSIHDFMDYDDLLRLTIWNHKYNLKGGHSFTFPPEVNWKRKILDNMESIFVASCPHEIVPHGFISVAKELFMIYQNSLNNATENHSETWNGFTSVLAECEDSLETFHISTEGFLATHVEVTTVGGRSENVEIPPLVEMVDNIPDIDVIVDTMWWLFSFSFGSCYWSAPIPTMWGSRYKRLYYTDFLNELKSRWGHAGPAADFGVIFGDFDLPVVTQNLRACVTAAYIKNGLVDRQLVRSISLVRSIPTNLTGLINNGGESAAPAPAPAESEEEEDTGFKKLDNQPVSHSKDDTSSNKKVDDAAAPSPADDAGSHKPADDPKHPAPPATDAGPNSPADDGNSDKNLP